MSDIRVQTSFFDHRKTKRLKRKCGLEGVICLQRLWAFAAESKRHGFLNDMTVDEIEEEAGWEGKAGAFFEAVTDEKIAYLDTFEDVPNLYYLHDWHQWQPYVVTGILRTWQARKNAFKKHEENEQTIIKMIGKKPEVDYLTLLHSFTQNTNNRPAAKKSESDRLATAEQSASIKERTAQRPAKDTERPAEPPQDKKERTAMLSSLLFSSSSGSISGTSSSSPPKPEPTAASDDAAEEKDALQKGGEDGEKTKTSEPVKSDVSEKSGNGKSKEIIQDGWKHYEGDEKYICSHPDCKRQTAMVKADTGYCANCDMKLEAKRRAPAGAGKA